MDKYIQEVYNNRISENKGYTYISTEPIYLPIYNVELSITKRKETKLNLVEEMILKLISNGITNINDISGILGIDRSMLNITIADLYLKDLAYNTASKCIIMQKGIEALKEFKLSTKESDILKNVYVDPISREIIDLKNEILIKKVSDKNKIMTIFDGEDIEFYRKNIRKIKEVFEEEIVKKYFDKNTLCDELVSVDDINQINIVFLEIPIQIYLNNDDLDFDILTIKTRVKDILDSNKSYIINEIREHRLLIDTFRLRKPKEYKQHASELQKKDNIYRLMKNYFCEESSKDEYYLEIKEISSKDREFNEDEFLPLYSYLIKSAKNIDFYVSQLDEWSKDVNFLNLLSCINKNCSYKIIYNEVVNEDRSKKRIRKMVYKIDKKKFIQKKHEDYLFISIDNKYNIIVEADIFNIIDKDRWVVKKRYYLKRNDIM
ncbi:hypothetical protein JY719_18145 [Clostridioides difficile]|nr:hypothetical protein [Clostridioides difficile]